MSQIINIPILIMFNIFLLNHVNYVNASNSTNATDSICEEGKIDCICGTPPNEKIRSFSLDRHLATALDLAVANCSNIQERTEFCKTLTCSLLNFTSGLLEASNNRSKRSSTKNTSYRLKVVPPAGMVKSSGHHVQRRFPKTCNDTLKPLNHAELTCWYWDNYVTCDVNCVHGYALRENGSVTRNTTRTCRETDAYWSPKAAFPVCEPYMNCKAVLVKPGDLKCQTSMKFPPYCEISCFADVEHDEIATRRYECVDDKFSKTLPHCAGVDKNVVLIERPRVSFTKTA